MGTGSVHNTGSNFQTSPTGNAGGAADFQKMPTDQLIDKLQNGTDPEKQMAAAELKKRFPDLFEPKEGDKDKTGGGKEKAGGGGGDKGVSEGGKDPIDPLQAALAKLREKVLSGQPLTPEEQQLLAALEKGMNPAALNEPSDPNKISSPVADPGKV